MRGYRRGKVVQALGIAGLRTDIQRKVKLGVERVKECLRCAPFRRQGAVADLQVALFDLAMSSLRLAPSGPRIRVEVWSASSPWGVSMTDLCHRNPLLICPCAAHNCPVLNMRINSSQDVSLW